MKEMIFKAILERLYRAYNRREYVHPDPLEFLYRYRSVCDREMAGLIASCLAYGRVTQILRSVRHVLDRLGLHPAQFVMHARPSDLEKMLKGFKHRFTTAGEIVCLLAGARRVVGRYGSLNGCFLAGMKKNETDLVPALDYFSRAIGCRNSYLVPSPEDGSACKRLNLFLRWMVRSDAVDPGGWHGIEKSQLIIPLDTHMTQIGRLLGITARKTANIGMAREITAAFGKIAPEDPVKYDFVLTRFGIRNEMNHGQLRSHFQGRLATGK